MQETWFQSMGWDDPLEEDMATHSITLAWRIPGTDSLTGYSPQGYKESDTTEELSMHTHTASNIILIILD